MEPAGVESCDRFKKVFLEKYFLRYLKTQIEMNFFELKQGSMTLAKYEKFTELARFVEEYANSDEKRAKRF